MDKTLTTGLGYYADDQGRCIRKFDLIPGNHRGMLDGYTIVEVGTREELDAIEMYFPPRQLTQQEIDEQKIAEKIRELAVVEIKKTDPSFRDPRGR